MKHQQKEQTKMNHEKPEAAQKPVQPTQRSQSNPRAHGQESEIGLGGGKRDQRFSENEPSNRRTEKNQSEEGSKEEEAAA